MDKLKAMFIPTTRLGLWSVGLIVVAPILFSLSTLFVNAFYQSTPSGSTIIEDVFSRPALAISMLLGIASGVLALITGVVAIARDKDRALLVFASTFLGTLFSLFILGEFAFPH